MARGSGRMSLGAQKARVPTSLATQQDQNAQLLAAYDADLTARTGLDQGAYEQQQAATAKREADEEANRMGAGEAFGRRALDSAALGFSDEIGGALGSAFTRQTYQQARDEIRAKNRKASEDQPLASGIGDILGGLATTVATAGVGGAAGLGARAATTVGRAALSGAAQGALSGAGYSEGTGISDILRDTATGAAVGGGAGAALHGAAQAVGKLFTPANKEQLTARVLDEVATLPDGRKVRETTRKHLAKAGDAIYDELVHGPDAPAVQAAYQAPSATKGRELLKPVIDRLGAERDAAYETFARHGVSNVDVPGEYLPKITEAAKAARRAGDKNTADGLEGIGEMLEAEAKKTLEAGGATDLPWLRAHTTSLQQAAASKIGGLEEHEAAKLAAGIAQEAKGVLDDVIADKAAALAKKPAPAGLKLPPGYRMTVEPGAGGNVEVKVSVKDDHDPFAKVREWLGSDEAKANPARTARIAENLAEKDAAHVPGEKQVALLRIDDGAGKEAAYRVDDVVVDVAHRRKGIAGAMYQAANEAAAANGKPLQSASAQYAGAPAWENEQAAASAWHWGENWTNDRARGFWEDAVKKGRAKAIEGGRYEMLPPVGAGGGGSAVKEVADAADALKAINRRFYGLLSLDDALGAKTVKEGVSGGPAEALVKKAGKLASIGTGGIGGAAGFAVGGPVGAALGAGLGAAVPGAARAFDRRMTASAIERLRAGATGAPGGGKVADALARLAKAARLGEVRPETVQRALAAGVPAGAISGVLALHRQALPPGAGLAASE